MYGMKGMNVLDYHYHNESIELKIKINVFPLAAQNVLGHPLSYAFDKVSS